ncbi:TPA: hypothetical protein QCI64_001550 [Enterobacter asburiae]|nr:hypothetical protein [Enterobacter asburiae]HCR2018695.1 hypothetical protein [Enterobacter asburiae]HCR2025486.1 hypothetical protein [Enterobacter asburiae]HCR2035154.1 hypothetical protein [Enterobacter asburiae]HCR2039356.1 hypothetical protein [Enterobacter asburiae]
MKLIDILVQELPDLGGWPIGADGLYQNAKGHLIGVQGCIISPVDMELGIVAEDLHRSVTREQYEAALAESKPQWDGEGLPPVGAEFEHSFHADGFSTWHWRRCTAVGKHGVLCVDEKDTELYLNDTNNRFRPIRSEADKKKEAVIFAIAELCRQSASNGHSAELIYDAIKSGKIVID